MLRADTELASEAAAAEAGRRGCWGCACDMRGTFVNHSARLMKVLPPPAPATGSGQLSARSGPSQQAAAAPPTSAASPAAPGATAALQVIMAAAADCRWPEGLAEGGALLPPSPTEAPNGPPPHGQAWNGVHLWSIRDFRVSGGACWGSWVYVSTCGGGRADGDAVWWWLWAGRGWRLWAGRGWRRWAGRMCCASEHDGGVPPGPPRKGNIRIALNRCMCVEVCGRGVWGVWVPRAAGGHAGVLVRVCTAHAGRQQTPCAWGALLLGAACMCPPGTPVAHMGARQAAAPAGNTCRHAYCSTAPARSPPPKRAMARSKGGVPGGHLLGFRLQAWRRGQKAWGEGGTRRGRINVAVWGQRARGEKERDPPRG